MSEEVFSQDEVEKALFNLMYERRKSLLETSDPIKARRLVSEIKCIGRVADMIYFNGLSDHMNVSISDLLENSSPRVVSVSAVLRPTFLRDGAKAGTSLLDGAEAGTSRAENGAKAGTFDGGKAGTSSVDGAKAGTLYGGGAGTSSVDGGGAGTSRVKDGWHRGVVIPSYDWHAGGSSDGAEAGPLDQEWTPLDDVAVGGDEAPSRSNPLSRLRERIKR